MEFRVGQKVVCVDDKMTGKYLLPGFCLASNAHMSGLRRGRIYTIRAANVVLGVAVCRLEEIVRGLEPFFGEEAYFAQARFRPVVERKTDISIFTAMLNPSKQGVDA